MPQGAKKAASPGAANPYKRGVAERLLSAFKHYNARMPRGKEITQGDLGRLVAKKLRLADPITQAAVSGWMNPDRPSIPDNPTLMAIADVLGADASYIILNLSEARPEEDAPAATRAKKA